jgi:hypothetical protein
MSSVERGDYGYARISKEDMGLDNRPVEELLQGRKVQIVRLARLHGDTIPDLNILLEAASGTDNSGRAKFLNLLDLVRQGRVRRLYAPQFDRLMRVEMAEAAEIKHAFKAGKVVLHTDAHTWDFGDPDFDYKYEVQFYQSALHARQTVLETSHKLKMNNPIRAARGVQMAGEAAFGIEWIAPVYRNRRLVHEGYYRVIEEEWRIIEEVYRLIWKMGARRIASHFTKLVKETGWPLTPAGKKIWNHTTILFWIGNPIYAGWPAHKFTNPTLKKRVEFPRDEWIWSDSEQNIRRYTSAEDWIDCKILTLEA